MTMSSWLRVKTKFKCTNGNSRYLQYLYDVMCTGGGLMCVVVSVV